MDAKLFVGLSTATLLAGCSLSPFITQYSLDYNSTIEDVSNSSLVINVLRGRDEAPLYFPDLSQIRGSTTASVSTQATIPFGPSFRPVTVGGVRRTAQEGPFSASTNPTFDIAPTNTKQFYQGILNPVSENLFAYYIERYRGGGSQSSELMFHLLVNGIDAYVDTNSTAPSRVISWRDREFMEIADRWTENLPPLVIPQKKISKYFGPPQPPDPKAVVQASTAGLDVKQAKTSPKGWLQFVKKTPGFAICFFDGSGYVRAGIEKNSVIKAPGGETTTSESESKTDPCSELPSGDKKKKWPGTHYARYILHLRSVEQIFYYLGAIVDPEGGFIRADGPHAGCPPIPFFIRDTPSEYARLAVSYRGRTYYISDTSRTDPCGGGTVDNTMPIFAVLSELLNLSRDANETPTTKAVQAVGG